MSDKSVAILKFLIQRETQNHPFSACYDAIHGVSATFTEKVLAVIQIFQPSLENIHRLKHYILL